MQAYVLTAWNFRLQEGTDYLFRVFSMNGGEKSEMLESVLITTKKRRGNICVSSTM